jgi:hypothetical protein
LPGGIGLDKYAMIFLIIFLGSFMKNLKTGIIIFVLPFLYSCAGVQPNQPKVTESKETAVLKPENSIIISGHIFEVQEVPGVGYVKVPIVGAKVQLSDKSAFSDKDGNYALPYIPYGNYKLIISKEAFTEIVDPEYKVHNNIGHLDARMERLENSGKKTIRSI